MGHSINLTVAAVLAAYAYLFYVAVFCVVRCDIFTCFRNPHQLILFLQIVPWLSYSVPGILNLGILSLTTSISLYAYLFCVLHDPGK